MLFTTLHNISKRERGFTLTELLVVIAIIGILSSVVLASLNSARAKGRDAKRVSDIKQLQLALEFYFDQNGNAYPDTGSGGSLNDLAGTYIPVLPKEPSSGNDYAFTSDGTTYTLAVQLELENNVLDEDLDAGSVSGVSCNDDPELGYCVGP